MTIPSTNISNDNLSFLISEVSKAHITSIITGGTPENIALAQRLVNVLPGTLVDNYDASSLNTIVIRSATTSSLEEDSSIILYLDNSEKTHSLFIKKNRSGNAGKIHVTFPADYINYP